MGHNVAIITNFSAPLKKILKLCNTVNSKFLYLAPSLHLEFVDPDDFLVKALKVKQVIGDRLGVSSVARKADPS